MYAKFVGHICGTYLVIRYEVYIAIGCGLVLNKTGTAVNKVKSLLKSWQAFAGFHTEAASSGHWGNVRLTKIIKKLTKMECLQQFLFYSICIQTKIVT